MAEENVVEEFYGVYLLYCLNPLYKGRTYIGYTVNPNRRIKQHNKGKRAGGAWRTSKRGPWEMVLIVHGFPNDISALRFEWAWQHPQRSCRLRHVEKKRNRESSFDFYLRVLSEMLRVGPWNRLPLTIRWLNQEYAQDFPVNCCPPLHMPVTYGPVVSKKVSKATTEESDIDTTLPLCSLCDDCVPKSQQMRCLKSSCLLICHVICLARCFLSDNGILPVQGECPACGTDMLWGDLVRKKKGCFSNLNEDYSS